MDRTDKTFSPAAALSCFLSAQDQLKSRKGGTDPAIPVIHHFKLVIKNTL